MHPYSNRQRNRASTRARAVATALAARQKLLAQVLATFAFLAMASLLFFAAGANKANSAQYPNCDDVPVEFRIVREFNWAEHKNWQRGFQMVRFTGAHEHRTVQYSGSEVSRRYCMAKAHFSNGEQRTIYYMISDIGGFVGLNWDVTHCVLGLDPWRNHDGECRAIR